jgi:hypothetical protein
MVEQIKKLEIMMDIHLEVVHVPGTMIITECTARLSRGIWISHMHERLDTAQLLAEIFAPVPFAPNVQQRALNQTGLPYEPCFHRCWEKQWDAQAVFDRLTIWTPPPEVAPQLIFFLLQCPVEKPLTTAALIVIPWILQKRWSRGSKHVFLKMGLYQRATVPLAHHSFLSIPIVLLWIPCHIRSLPPLRLDPAPQTPCGSSTDNRRNLCVGCSKPLMRTEPQFGCQFCDQGFLLDEYQTCPCWTRYHPGCIRMGLPFTTQLQKGGRMQCPKDYANW